MSEPTNRDIEVTKAMRQARSVAFIKRNMGEDVPRDKDIELAAFTAYREEIEARLAPAPVEAGEDEALLDRLRELNDGLDLDDNEESAIEHFVNRGVEFKLSKQEALAALRSRQSPPPPIARCWWNEGGRCYVEPVTRDSTGRSTKIACCPCDQYKAKRDMLENVIPRDRLEIVSELNGETGKHAAPQPSPQGEDAIISSQRLHTALAIVAHNYTDDQRKEYLNDAITHALAHLIESTLRARLASLDADSAREMRK